MRGVGAYTSLITGVECTNSTEYSSDQASGKSYQADIEQHYGLIGI
jgi:hypothetical protein